SSILYAFKCNENQEEVVVLKCNDTYDKCGYINKNNDTVIEFGKYSICYTDTLKYYAIVLCEERGVIAINPNDEMLFRVFIIDNSPDTPKEGLFRIYDEQGKIGYANIKGEIVISPEYDCAFPFDNGKAKVAKHCSTQKVDEYSAWESSQWYYINTKGEIVN